MTFWEKIKCRLRIVDSYGTDPWFNEPSLAVKSGSGQGRNFYNPKILFAEDTGFSLSVCWRLVVWNPDLNYFQIFELSNPISENDSGELGLPSLKQFLTKYPTATNNFWGGFVIHENQAVDDKDPETKNAFLYGYSAETAENQGALLQLLRNYYNLFVSLPDDTVSLPLNITNMGVLSYEETNEMLDLMSLVVGLGR